MTPIRWYNPHLWIAYQAPQSYYSLNVTNQLADDEEAIIPRYFELTSRYLAPQSRGFLVKDIVVDMNEIIEEIRKGTCPDQPSCDLSSLTDREITALYAGLAFRAGKRANPLVVERAKVAGSIVNQHVAMLAQLQETQQSFEELAARSYQVAQRTLAYIQTVMKNINLDDDQAFELYTKLLPQNVDRPLIEQIKFLFDYMGGSIPHEFPRCAVAFRQILRDKLQNCSLPASAASKPSQESVILTEADVISQITRHALSYESIPLHLRYRTSVILAALRSNICNLNKMAVSVHNRPEVAEITLPTLYSFYLARDFEKISSKHFAALAGYEKFIKEFKKNVETYSTLPESLQEEEVVVALTVSSMLDNLDIALNIDDPLTKKTIVSAYFGQSSQLVCSDHIVKALSKSVLFLQILRLNPEFYLLFHKKLQAVRTFQNIVIDHFIPLGFKEPAFRIKCLQAMHSPGLQNSWKRVCESVGFCNRDKDYSLQEPETELEWLVKNFLAAFKYWPFFQTYPVGEKQSSSSSLTLLWENHPRVAALHLLEIFKVVGDQTRNRFIFDYFNELIFELDQSRLRQKDLVTNDLITRVPATALPERAVAEGSINSSAVAKIETSTAVRTKAILPGNLEFSLSVLKEVLIAAPELCELFQTKIEQTFQWTKALRLIHKGEIEALLLKIQTHEKLIEIIRDLEDTPEILEIPKVVEAILARDSGLFFKLPLCVQTKVQFAQALVTKNPKFFEKLNPYLKKDRRVIVSLLKKAPESINKGFASILANPADMAALLAEIPQLWSALEPTHKKAVFIADLLMHLPSFIVELTASEKTLDLANALMQNGYPADLIASYFDTDQIKIDQALYQYTQISSLRNTRKRPSDSPSKKPSSFQKLSNL